MKQRERGTHAGGQYATRNGEVHPDGNKRGPNEGECENPRNPMDPEGYFRLCCCCHIANGESSSALWAGFMIA